MAIKPTDFIIYIKDLIVNVEREVGRDGFTYTTVTYQPFWENFIRGINKNCFMEEYERNLNKELKKFGGSYKRTKSGNSYLKFRSAKHYTLFVLRWT